VDQPDHRRRERPACMPGLAATPASLPTSPKLGVERLQSLSIEPAHRHCAQHRPHMPVQPAHHAVAGGLLQLHNLKPPVEQLVHRRLRARVATLIYLIQQPRPHPLGVPGRRRSGRHRLDQVMPLLRHRIDAGVDPSPEAIRWAAARPHHGSDCDPETRPPTPTTLGIRTTEAIVGLAHEVFPLVIEPPWGIEPQTYALREPLPVLTLALTRNFGCMVGISRRPQAR
jgi:hypothetical protein